MYSNAISGVVMFLVLVVGVVSASAVGKAPFLFTEDEQKTFNYEQSEWQSELDNHLKNEENMSQAKGVGPNILVVVPELVKGVYRSQAPLKLLIFLKGALSPVDIDSLKVKGKRGFISLDITNRIVPYIRNVQQGEEADFVIDARIPQLGSGHYRIFFSIADIQGNEKQMDVFLEVF